VHYVAAPGEFTFARVMHDGTSPVLAAFRGQAIEGQAEWLSRSCRSWPHMFVRTSSSHERILDRLHANHIHAVGGDWMESLSAFARMVGIAFVGF
jgi:L-fucose isomerase-like protein